MTRNLEEEVRKKLDLKSVRNIDVRVIPQTSPQLRVWPLGVGSPLPYGIEPY